MQKFLRGSSQHSYHQIREETGASYQNGQSSGSGASARYLSMHRTRRERSGSEIHVPSEGTRQGFQGTPSP